MSCSSTFPARLRAAALLATAPGLTLVAPPPAASWAALSSAQDPTAPLVGLVALTAWACTAWLALLVVLVWGAAAPGAVGRFTGRAAERVAPASVRALVRVALGTTVALTVLGGSSSAFADARPAASSSLDWPGAAPPASPDPSLDWASPSSPPASAEVRLLPRPTVRPGAARTAAPVSVHRRAASVPVHTPATAVVSDARVTVVRPGDSLWRIAARSLGPGATPRQVARAWPQWWSANRDVIGEHPDLIHPGDSLAAPTH